MYKYIAAAAVVVILGGLYFFLDSRGATPGNSDSANVSAGTGTPAPAPSSVSSTNEVKIETTQAGQGEGAKDGDTLTVHYTGLLEDGTKFDSSVDRGEPFVFKLGEHKVIPGWEMGLQGMKVGEKRKVVIPPGLGYGENGFPGVIPGNATLYFDVELLKIN